MTAQKVATVQVDGQEWYTAGGAASVISKTSQRTVKPAYLRVLARIGKVATKFIDDSTMLYLKSDVDGYKVEARGKKAAAAMQARAKKARVSKKKPGVTERTVEPTQGQEVTLWKEG